MPPTFSSTPFSGIFVSYRRDDSSGHAGRLFDNLVNHFGRDRIFMDIDTIEPGEDFVTVIENAVASCDLLIAIIGQNWLRGTKGEIGRLDDPNDFVRVEIATALDRDIRVIPVLVQRASMPLQHDLPDNLAKLARRNAIELSDRRWQNDVEQLIKVMDRVLAQREQAKLAKAARDAEAKRQSEVEEEQRRIEEEKQRLLSEDEAKRKAAEKAKRVTEERERLALIEKRHVEEERQKAYEEERAVAEKRAAEEDSPRQQSALNEKIDQDSVGFIPNLIPATNASESSNIFTLHDRPSLDEGNRTRTKRLIIIASIAFIAIAALVITIVMLRPRTTNTTSLTPSPVSTPTPLSTPTESPTRPKYDFAGLKIRIVYIAKRKDQTLSVAKRLREYGATVELRDTTDDAFNEPHIGKLYYHDSHLSQAKEIAESISDRVKVVPTVYHMSKYDSDFVIWIVGR